MLLDSLDERIIRLLRAQGRISNADLAEAVGLSPPPACGGCGNSNRTG